MPADNKLPLYTRIGARVTAIIILALTILIIKNCVGSIQYGISTTDNDIKYYYNLGYSAGTNQTESQKQFTEPVINNPLLQKTYHKGFRDGWDSRAKGKAAD